LKKEELFKIEYKKPNEEIFKAVQLNWDRISKPIDGFGSFEKVICKIGSILECAEFRQLKKSVVIMCADNGIVEEGVSQSDQSITAAVAKMIGNNTSTICTLAASANVECVGVDIGINCEDVIPGIINAKIVKGTKNFLKEPAMNEEQTMSAINAGIDLVNKLKQNGTDIIATGEMGIGNTTTTSAVLCALTGVEPEIAVGRGAGLSDEGLNRKLSVVKKAVELYGKSIDVTEQEKAFEVLCNCGGADIAGLVGVFIGGAMYGVPIVIDGFISAVAALVADAIVPGVRDFMIASHKGRESGTEIVLKMLALEPYINGDMALGEGTGAVMMLSLIDMMINFYNKASRFEDAKIEQYERYEN